MSGRGKKGLLLLSGGFDSPVAGALMQERGLIVDALHFSLEPVTDDTAEKKCLRLIELLKFNKVFIARVGKAFTEIALKTSRRYYFVLSKRFMLRVAEKIALLNGYDYLVTGENLGQVSSQTLQNLRVIDSAIKLPVIRPLLGLDKEEILSVAKQLGTYEISKGPEICDALGPEKPSTAANLHIILEEEEKFNWTQLADRIAEDLQEKIITSSNSGVSGR